MAEYIPPDEMAEIIKDQLAGKCINCEDNVVWEGTPEDIDPTNEADLMRFMKLVGEVHIQGGISEVEEYIKKLGEAYGAGMITVTTDAREVAKDWLEKKYDKYVHSHEHDHDHDHEKDVELDQTPMIVVDKSNNLRFRCIKGRCQSILDRISEYDNVSGWRAVTYEEFEELNKSV
jgi:hypothetical protein